TKDRTTVRRRAVLRLGHAEVDPADGVFQFRVNVLGRQAPARAHVEAAQIEDLVDAQRGLPDRRRLKRRADQVDVAGAQLGAFGDLVLELLVRVQTIDVGQIRTVRADVEAAGELRLIVGRRLALERARQVARV